MGSIEMRRLTIPTSPLTKSLRSPFTKSAENVLMQPRDAQGHWIPVGARPQPKDDDKEDEKESGSARTSYPRLSLKGRRAVSAYGPVETDVYLSIDAGKPQHLASRKEWALIQRWARRLDVKRHEELVQLIEHGVHEKVAIVFAQLRDAVKTLKQVPNILKRFGRLLKQGGDVVSLNNGRPRQKSLRSFLRKSGQWDESKHNRDHGKFSSTPGAGAAIDPAGGAQTSPGTGASPGIVGQHGGPREQTGTGADQPKGPGQAPPQRDQALVRQKVGERIDRIGQLSIEDIQTHGAKAGIPKEVLTGDKPTVMQNLKTWVETGEIPKASAGLKPGRAKAKEKFDAIVANPPAITASTYHVQDTLSQLSPEQIRDAVLSPNGEAHGVYIDLFDFFPRLSAVHDKLTGHALRMSNSKTSTLHDVPGVPKELSDPEDYAAHALDKMYPRALLAAEAYRAAQSLAGKKNNGRPRQKSIRTPLTKSGRFDESKVHRGQPGNAGQFGPGGASPNPASGAQQKPGRGAAPGIVGQHGGPREQTGTGADMPKGPAEQISDMYASASTPNFLHDEVSAKIKELGKLSVAQLKEAGLKADVPESVLQGSKKQILRNLENYIFEKRSFHQRFSGIDPNESLKR